MAMKHGGRGPGHLSRWPKAAGPVASGTVNLSFTSGSMPSGATLTRASSGTRFNSSAVLVTEGTDVARFGYSYTSPGTIRGLMIEPARTNHALYTATTSLDSFNAVGGVSLTLTGGTAPDGNTAGRAAWAGTGLCYRQDVPSQGASTLTNSAWLKVASGSPTDTRLIDPPNVTYQNVSPTSSWAQYTVPAAQTSSSGAGAGFIGFFNTTTAYDLDVCFIQSEVGTTATSFIPTTTASVTRAQDVLTIAGSVLTGVSSITISFDDAANQVMSITPGVDLVLTSASLNGIYVRTIVNTP